jgi:hypothetical protein
MHNTTNGIQNNKINLNQCNQGDVKVTTSSPTLEKEIKKRRERNKIASRKYKRNKKKENATLFADT